VYNYTNTKNGMKELRYEVCTLKMWANNATGKWRKPKF